MPRGKKSPMSASFVEIVSFNLSYEANQNDDQTVHAKLDFLIPDGRGVKKLLLQIRSKKDGRWTKSGITLSRSEAKTFLDSVGKLDPQIDSSVIVPLGTKSSDYDSESEVKIDRVGDQIRIVFKGTDSRGDDKKTKLLLEEEEFQALVSCSPALLKIWNELSSRDADVDGVRGQDSKRKSSRGKKRKSDKTSESDNRKRKSGKRATKSAAKSSEDESTETSSDSD